MQAGDVSPLGAAPPIIMTHRPKPLMNPQRNTLHPIMFAVLMLASLFTGTHAAAQPDADPIRPRLIAQVQSIQPGQTVTVAAHFQILEGWHLYWTNPEGAGFPPSVEWNLPEGYTVSEPRWPAPHTFESFGSVQYGYEDQLTLLFDITAPDNATDQATLEAGLGWLVCDEGSCVPSPGYPTPVNVSLTLPINSDVPQASADAGLISQAQKQVPTPASGWSFQTELTDAGYTLHITTPSEAIAQSLKGLYFFSHDLHAVDPVAKQIARVKGSTVSLALKAREKDAYDEPIVHDPPITSLRGVLTAKSGFGDAAPYALLVGGQALSTEPNADPPDEAQAVATNSADSEAPIGFALALGMAFLGGMILNLMPCVFPVLSIKILGFVQQAGEKPASVRRHGYAFGAGVMLSFWMLVALLLILRTLAEQTGSGVSWGFQLQNPLFVLGMLLLVFLIGLNLIGTFEIGIGLSAAAGKASQSVKKEGYSKSFFTGVLATLIATPCTGPLMAPAIGAALSMPDLQAFLVFTSLGLGMATPYVLLSCFPTLLKYLPRPGAWMESFKQAMAFPMFATASWLAWVYAGLTSEAMVARLLIGLTIVAMGAWIFGRWSTPIRTPHTRWGARVLAMASVVGGVAMVHTGALAIERDRQAIIDARAAGEYVYEWVDYTPEAVSSLRQSGRPVLIDFTARWCAICQANKKSSLRTDRAQSLYKQHNVALISADNTVSNPDIDKVLKQYNRAGVPLYLVFPADGGEPEVLPELLTPTILKNAIERATAKQGEAVTAS